MNEKVKGFLLRPSHAYLTALQQTAWCLMVHRQSVNGMGEKEGWEEKEGGEGKEDRGGKKRTDRTND